MIASRVRQACIRFLKMYSSYPAPFSVFIGLDSLQRWLVHAPCRACGGEPNGRRNLRPPVRRQDVTVQLQQLTARDRCVKQRQNVAPPSYSQLMSLPPRLIHRYIEQKEHAAKAETGYKLRALEESLRKGEDCPQLSFGRPETPLMALSTAFRCLRRLPSTARV